MLSISKHFKNAQALFLQLSPNGRKLLLSFFLFALASPMINLFTNFFLWRQGQEILLIVLLNIGIYMTMPMGFFSNAFLLRHVSITKLYFGAAVIQGIAPMILIFCRAVDPWQVFLIGLLLGYSSGFFWGNRNLLTAEITQSEDRIRFISLEAMVSATASIISPIVTGWILVSGRYLQNTTPELGYQIMSTIAVILLWWSGKTCFKIDISVTHTSPLLLKKPISIWSSQRMLETLIGVEHSWAIIVTPLLVFFFLEKESSVGMLNSFLALLSATMVYYAAHWKTKELRMTMLGWWLTGAIIATGFFLIQQSLFGALMYLGLTAVTGGFYNTGVMSLLYDVVDLDKGHRKYTYLADRESFLTLGRITGLMLFTLVYSAFPHAALLSFMIARVVLKTALYWQIKQVHEALPHQIFFESRRLALVPVKATR